MIKKSSFYELLLVTDWRESLWKFWIQDISKEDIVSDRIFLVTELSKEDIVSNRIFLVTELSKEDIVSDRIFLVTELSKEDIVSDRIIQGSRTASKVHTGQYDPYVSYS